MSLYLVVLHPVEYQIPFYNELSHILGDELTVFFMDDHSLKPYSTKSWGKNFTLPVRSVINPHSYLFRYFFSRNLSPFKHKVIVNRLNLDIIFKIIFDKPDMVLLTGYTSLTSIILLLLNKFLPTCLCLRAEGGLLGKKTKTNAVTTTIINWLVNRADYFFYSCQDNKNLYLKRGFDEFKMHPLLSSVDNNYFADTIISHHCNSYPFPYHLVASKLESRKNIQETIIGFVTYKDHCPSTNLDKLLIVGVGHCQSDLMSLATNRDDIIFHGYAGDISQMRELVQNSKSVVLSSFYDPSPKILNEAMACSKPILCSDSIGTSLDLVQHLGNGYIYKTSNISDLRKGFDWINSNYNSPEISEISAHKAIEWSPRANAASVNQLYTQIIA